MVFSFPSVRSPSVSQAYQNYVTLSPFTMLINTAFNVCNRWELFLCIFIDLLSEEVRVCTYCLIHPNGIPMKYIEGAEGVPVTQIGKLRQR